MSIIYNIIFGLLGFIFLLNTVVSFKLNNKRAFVGWIFAFHMLILNYFLTFLLLNK